MLVLRIPGAPFCLVFCLLFRTGEETVRLQELEGNTVTIHTGLTGVQSDAQILWNFVSEKADIKIVDSLVFRGETIIDYNSDRFRDRLQLDRSSGSLTIRNISREDFGLYTVHIITGSLSFWSFIVKVYAPVSKPVIKPPENHSGNQIEKHSGCCRESCSPECSVENGEDVSLSWYEEEEKISSISRADSSDHLHLPLPLNRTFSTSSTYTCVSANPVSNQTTQLNITAICDSNTADRKKFLAAVLIPVGLFVAVLLFMSLLWLWIKKRRSSGLQMERSTMFKDQS